MASASAMADGFLALLGAASVFGSDNVSKNSYKILETSACAAVVISYARAVSEPVAFGDYNRQRDWVFNLRLYLRDTGNPIDLLNRTFTATETMLDALETDPTVQGTAVKINSIDINNSPGETFVVGGQTWLYIPCAVGLTSDW